MATTGGSSQLALVCATASFLWLVHNLDSHQLIEQPRLSSVLCLFISGTCAFAVSFLSLWLPGANGRFDDDLGGLRMPVSVQASRVSLPRKPRRFFLPALVVCIILRLELFHRVSSGLLCSSSGIQVWVLLAILLYDLFSGRRPRSRSGGEKAEDDDMGQTLFDALFSALANWFHGSTLPLLTSVLALTYGTSLVFSQESKSTAFCSSTDNRLTIVFYQWAGIFLDTALIIMSWRVLAWARTTKSRLRALGAILISSSGGMGFLYLAYQSLQPGKPMSYHFRGLDSLYCFDIVVDGLALGLFLISTSLLTTDGSPLPLVGITVFADGLSLAIQQIWFTRPWENVSPATTYLAIMLICGGFACFIYANNLRTVLFLRRALVVFSLLVVTISATIYTLLHGRRVLDGHPLDRLIYDGRVEADRFLLQASVSDSLAVAVQEYKERHGGRDPPQKFDVWYQFAKERKSPIIDHFAQIDLDLLPFYGMAPEKIRQGIHQLRAEPDIMVVRIQNGTVVHGLPSGSPHQPMVDDFAGLIKAFGKHLQDGLEFAVNLNNRPRVLAPWEDRNRFAVAARPKGLSGLLTRRSADVAALSRDPLQQRGAEFITMLSNYTTPSVFREMTAIACPLGTETRSGVHRDNKAFCSSCVRPQSQQQYLEYWSKSLELCHQSDLLQLHGFHMSPPNPRPLQELLPVFSGSKTSSYSDILIPLRREGHGSSTGDRDFGMKRRQLFWRGKLEVDALGRSDLLRSGHQERLSHLINNASASDKTTVLLPASRKPGKFIYEEVSIATLNSALPIDVGFNEITDPCEGCRDAARSEFGLKPEEDSTMYQYVLVMDTENGPPDNLLGVLHSKSVPFLSTIFREWYSERLLPWVHFVPIDIRFHALHSTLAYFTGLGSTGKEKINGRKMKMDSKVGNAEWIADEGRRFASKALRKEDMEVYMFRLLLEWSRLVSDQRDELHFVL